MSSISATWTKLLATGRLQRSSQTLSVIDNTAYIFGGEVQPRQPVDNQLDIISLSKDAPASLQTKSHASSPSPRVGTAAATLNGFIYLFSGRGGTDMAPIEEHGSLHCFNPTNSSWSLVTVADATQSHPQARSYHCMASDAESKIFVHAGCPAKGRLSDLWVLDIEAKTWTELPPAPEPARGGTSIAFHGGKIYRMNGFDGTKEQGGALDVFDLKTSTWSTISFPPDGKAGPEPRSVSALVPITSYERTYLVTLFGERDPSSLGHAGAGKMLGDVWAWDIEGQGWEKVEFKGPNGDSHPEPRGWFDADVTEGGQGVLVHGGLGENNERLGDVWVLRF